MSLYSKILTNKYQINYKPCLGLHVLFNHNGNSDEKEKNINFIINLVKRTYLLNDDTLQNLIYLVWNSDNSSNGSEDDTYDLKKQFQNHDAFFNAYKKQSNLSKSVFWLWDTNIYDEINSIIEVKLRNIEVINSHFTSHIFLALPLTDDNNLSVNLETIEQGFNSCVDNLDNYWVQGGLYLTYTPPNSPFLRTSYINETYDTFMKLWGISHFYGPLSSAAKMGKLVNITWLNYLSKRTYDAVPDLSTLHPDISYKELECGYTFKIGRWPHDLPINQNPPELEAYRVVANALNQYMPYEGFRNHFENVENGVDFHEWIRRFNDGLNT